MSSFLHTGKMFPEELEIRWAKPKNMYLFLCTSCRFHSLIVTNMQDRAWDNKITIHYSNNATLNDWSRLCEQLFSFSYTYCIFLVSEKKNLRVRKMLRKSLLEDEVQQSWSRIRLFKKLKRRFFILIRKVTFDTESTWLFYI